VCVNLRICTQTSHVSLYILPYKYAESTYVTYTPPGAQELLGSFVKIKIYFVET